MRTYLLSTITTTYTWRQRNFYVEAKRTRTCEHIIIEGIEVVCTCVRCTCSQVHTYTRVRNVSMGERSDSNFGNTVATDRSRLHNT